MAGDTYSGGTDGVAVVTPAQTYGSPTVGVASVPPPQNFDGPTGGTSASLVPPRSFGAATGGVFIGFVGPITLTATVVDAGCIRLDWIDVTPFEDGFQIQRSLENANDWDVIGTVGQDVETFLDRFSVPLTVYDYRVRGTTLNGNISQPSNIATAVTPEPPDLSTGPPPISPTDPPRNRIQPKPISFESSGVYGLEKDENGNVRGFKY